MTDRYELRPWPYVAAGYVAGPLASIAVGWIALLAVALADPAKYLPQALAGAGAFTGGLGFLGAAIAAGCATPVLVGLRFYRWRWPNVWTVLAVGFAATTLLELQTFVFILSPGPRGAANVVGGVATAAFWTRYVIPAMVWECVGAISAPVVWLVAVRRTAPVESDKSAFD
jgi:hypothetical protein